MARRRKTGLPQDMVARVQKIKNLSPENVNLREAINSFSRHHLTKGTRQSTINWYVTELLDFERFLQQNNRSLIPSLISREDVEDYILFCREKKLKPTTINGRLRSLRTFFNYLVEKKVIQDSPMHKVPLVRHTKRAVPAFTEEQLRDLLEQPNLSTFAGFRDYVIMYILLDTGVRIGELLKASPDDIVWENGIPTTLVIRSPKGPKERQLPFSPKTQQLLSTYLDTVKRSLAKMRRCSRITKAVPSASALYRNAFQFTESVQDCPLLGFRRTLSGILLLNFGLWKVGI